MFYILTASDCPIFVSEAQLITKSKVVPSGVEKAFVTDPETDVR